MHSLAAQSGAVQLPQPVAERRLRNGTIPGTFFVGMTSSQDAIESYTRCTPRLFSPATMGRNLLTRPCQPDNRNEHEGMTAYRSSGDDEGDADRLRGLLATGALSVELASAFAGDRPLTDDEKVRLVGLQEHRGERFFSDLLYAITHQFFAPAAAEKLWVEILQHKYEMSRALCRNVRITVATLDFLSNCRDRILLPTLVNEAHIAEIVEHALRDGLTGLFNHTSFMEMLELELRKSARYGTAVSLIMADIDDFKDVNDRHGHQEGDRVLVELAGMIMKATRDSDICCRYGGE